MDMPNYGELAQNCFHRNADRSTCTELSSVTVERGALTDSGLSKGVFPVGSEVKITAPATDATKAPFAYWMNERGEEVSRTLTATVTVPATDTTYLPVYSSVTSPTVYSKEALATNRIPCEINFDPDERYTMTYQYFAMQASVEMTAGGRLWSCWIGGGDNADAYLIATYSDDKGESWEDIQFVIDPHNDSLPLSRNTHIGCFWQDPRGRLWLFYQQSLGMWDGEGANFAIVCENPDAEHPTWSEPQYISIGASLKKPIVTKNGEWILPVSIWERGHMSEPIKEIHKELDALRGARFYASVDEGKTWEYRGGIDFTDNKYNEHSVVELDDGRLMVYSRCVTAIRKAYSTDGGRTWSEEEIAFPHVNSLAMIRTLPSGNLLLIKHGQSMTVATEKRSHLTAFISRDGGITWEGGLLLDERIGVSYPDIALATDGTIFVQYDYNRKSDAQILFARFTEAEVLAGRITEDTSALRQIIKDTDGIKGHPVTLAEGLLFGGTGTSTDPYTVSSAEQWRYFIRRVNGGHTFEDEYVILTADIDFGGKRIQPVGSILQGNTHARPFRGSFDGKGHTVSGFVIDTPDLYCRALFGYLPKGSIKNLTVDHAFIRGRTNVGAIVGNVGGNGSSDRTKIENCTVGENVRIIGYQRVGGVVGNAENYVTIKNCVNNASVTAPYASPDNDLNVGGIVGYVNNCIHVESCTNNGTVTARHGGNTYIGGIVSDKKDCTVFRAVNYGNVTVDTCVGAVYVDDTVGFCDKEDTPVLPPITT